MPWPIQAKLEIGAVDDPLEREADQVADRVLGSTTVANATLPSGDAKLRRTCACGGATGTGGSCKQCEEEREAAVRRSAIGPGPAEAPVSVHEALRGPSEPLDAGTREFVESRMGHDFGHVRVHTGGTAARSAREVNALAYTMGPDVVFGEGRYRPGTAEGQKLLVHELAHVVQQRAGTVVRRQPANAASGTQLDEFTATIIAITADFDASLGVAGLVMRAGKLREDFERAGPDPNDTLRVPKMPRTYAQAARALVKLYGVLQKLEAEAPHDTDGALLTNETTWGTAPRKLVPWTPQRPHSLADIPTFSPENVQEWYTVLSLAPPPAKGAARATPAPAKSAETKPTGTEAPGAKPTDEASEWMHKPEMFVGSGVEEQSFQTGEDTGEPLGGSDIDRGLAVLMGANLGKAEVAVSNRLNDEEGKTQGDEAQPKPKVIRTGKEALSLLNACGQILYIANRAYLVDRAGRIQSTEFYFDVGRVTLEKGGVYFLAPFFVRTLKSETAFRFNALVQIKGNSVNFGAGDIFPRAVITSLVPLLEMGRAVLRANAGIGIIVSPEMASKPLGLSDLSLKNVKTAIDRAASTYIGLSVVRVVKQKLESWKEEIINQAIGLAVGELMRLLPELAAPVMMAQIAKGTVDVATMLNIAAYARGNDEVDLAAQGLALWIAELAVDTLIAEGAARAKAGVTKFAKGRLGDGSKAAGPREPAPKEPHEPAESQAERRKAAEDETKKASETKEPHGKESLPESLSGCRMGSLYCPFGDVISKPEFRQHIAKRPHRDFVGEIDLNFELVKQPSLRKQIHVPTGNDAYIRFLAQVRHSDWSPEFLAEMFRIDRLPASQRETAFRELNVRGRTYRWPLDNLRRPWQVHHEPPLDWGGLDTPEFWKPVPQNVHDDLGRWWDGLAKLFLKQFPREQWREIVSDEEIQRLGVE